MYSLLKTILWLGDEYFFRNHSYESELGESWILNQCLREPKHGLMQNRDGKPCSVSDKCGQAARYLHREVAKFEELVGPIERLERYEDSWRNDKDA